MSYTSPFWRISRPCRQFTRNICSLSIVTKIGLVSQSRSQMVRAYQPSKVATTKVAASIALPPTTPCGASRPLRRLPAMVSFLSRKPALSLDGRNRSSCPTPAVRDTRRDRLNWVSMTAIGSVAGGRARRCRSSSEETGTIALRSSARHFAISCPVGARSCSIAKLLCPMERGCHLDTLLGR